VGTTAKWSLESPDLPQGFVADPQNSGSFEQMSDDAGAFGRFVQALSNRDADGGARFVVVVGESNTRACLSARIRHPIAWPSEPFQVEELLGFFVDDAGVGGFVALLQSGGRLTTKCLFTVDDGATATANTNDVGPAVSDWHVWQLQMVREADGVHLGLTVDGNRAVTCAPFLAGHAASGFIGFGPRPFTALDASVTIDYADIRVDLDE
jgi:hypothetical protein